MRYVRLASCLAVMFVVSMVAAGTASAAPHWLVCSEGTGSSTKYGNNQCETASSSGKFEWVEPKTTEAVISRGSLKLEANAPIVGEVEVTCAGRDAGWIGPNGKDEITEVEATACKAGKSCEKIENAKGVAEPVNLPWNTELKETEGLIHDAIRAGPSGKEPGWKVICKVLGKKEENVCTSEKGLVVLENKDTPGLAGALLVLANFINPNKPKANCTATGTETGNVSGSIAILLASGAALRVSK